MAKRPLQWHKGNLKNMRAYLKNLKEELNVMVSRVRRIKEDIKFHTWQIEEAEKRGKTEFDSGRFLVRSGRGGG